MPEALVCDAVRTPIGRYGGALSTVRPDDLAAVPIRALMQRSPEFDWSKVDEVILGDRESGRRIQPQRRADGGALGWTAGGCFRAPRSTDLCASGMDAVGFAARGIKAGDYDVTIAGGVESMSRAPFVMPKAEAGFFAQQCGP